MNDNTPTWTARPIEGFTDRENPTDRSLAATDATVMPDDSALRSGRNGPISTDGSTRAESDHLTSLESGPHETYEQRPRIVEGSSGQTSSSTARGSSSGASGGSSGGIVMLAVVGVTALIILGLAALVSTLLTGTPDAVAVVQAEESDESTSSDSLAPDVSQASEASSTVSGDASVGSRDGQFGTVADAYEQSAHARLEGLSLYLEGTVPSQAVGDEVESRAAELLGRPAVKAKYEVDPEVALPEDPPLFASSAVLFEQDGAVNAGSMGTLNLAFSLLADYPEARVIVTAPSADQLEVGQLPVNEKQATAVMQFWIEKGLDPDRVRVEVPESSDTDSTADGVLEREVEFVVRGLLSADQL